MAEISLDRSGPYLAANTMIIPNGRSCSALFERVDLSAPAGWYDDGFGNRRWWDGVAWSEWVDSSEQSATSEQHSRETLGRPDVTNGFAHEVATALPPPRARKRVPVVAKVLFSVLGAVLVAAAVTFVVALGTAERWSKVEIPAQQETFHWEEYSTGNFVIVDNGVSPCFVGQDWGECRNSLVDEYNRECVGRSLTSASVTVCDDYGAEIDRMDEVGEYWWTVESLGGYGYLQSTPEMDTRSVSNNDYRPAVTREAICYLGFIGECQ